MGGSANNNWPELQIRLDNNNVRAYIISARLGQARTGDYMKVLRDGHGKRTGLLLNGRELQRVTDLNILKYARNYSIAQEGTEYVVRASDLLLDRIETFLSME